MGKIFDIQRLSVHDGPGIRTTVFLKGCPLRCLWCHNIESQSMDISIGYNIDKCTNCGECGKVCKAHSFADGMHHYDREICNRCGKCIGHCPNDAMITLGKEVTAAEVIEEVLRDKVFYTTSGGGVTFSGGEPLSQPDFLFELLKLSKEAGLHTAVDTSGFADKSVLLKILPYVDLFLYDWKETDDVLHKKYTGISHRIIKENLKLLNEHNAALVLRCPIIPTLNDREDHYMGIAELVEEFSCIREVNIMAYHRLGNVKYQIFGVPNEIKKNPLHSATEKKEIIKFIHKAIEQKTKRDIKVE